jgi:hypothetical protein
LNESKALFFLENETCPETRYLMKKLNNGEFYKKACEVWAKFPTKRLKRLCENWKERRIIADEISESFNLEPQRVCVIATKSKAMKGNNNPEYIAKVFVDKKIEIEKNDVENFLL